MIDNMNLLSAGVELFAAAIIAILLLGCRMECRYRDKTNRLFVAVLLIQMTILIGDAVIWLLLSEPSPGKVLPVKLLTLLTDVMTVVLTAVYSHLLTNYVAKKKPVSFLFPRIVTVVCAAVVVVWGVCLFNDLYIWYDANGDQHEGPVYKLVWLLGLLLMAVCVLYAVWHRRTLGRADTWALCTYGLFPVFGYLLEPYWSVTPLLLGATLSLLLMYVVIHSQQTRRAMEQQVQLANMEAELARQETELSKNRVNIMHSQIQPHFLFNALTSISVLCERDPLQAQTALNDFADYLRGNLDSLKRAAPVPFSRELKHVETYLSLEKMRFEDELNVVYDIQTDGFLIPSLTVQPLVENAVKYGVGKKPGGGTVTITTREQEECYQITVSDDGVGYDPGETQYDGRTHIGINNVRARLASMVGGTLTVESAVGSGTTAVIQIPKEKHT